MDENLLSEISLPNRHGTHSAKWDGLTGTFGQDGLLPMWVADMDFKTPKCVRQALHAAVDQGAFGYYQVPDQYWESILAWERDRHGTHLERAWLRNTAGVVPGLFHLLQAITQPGDGILVQTPVYYPFYRAIEATDRRVVPCALTERAGVYTVDLAKLEKTLVREKVKLFLLCSPHNPVGRVWTREELAGMLACCQRHGIQVVSDEIHHDLIQPGHRHWSAVSVWEGEKPPITFFSASKTFNLAGMKNSILVIPDPEMRERFDAYESSLGTGEGSTLDYVAVTAAFQQGGPWLDTVLEVIGENYRCLRDTLAPLPGVTVSPLEGTYLMWIDLGGVISPADLREFMQQGCGIAPDYGPWFYPKAEKAGDCHIRLNLAAPAETIRLAAARMEEALKRVLGL